MQTVEAIRQCVVFEEVNEAFSTQTCSCCGSIPPSSPKGRASLGIRRWTCSDCGAEHDRDTNAARNIARLGLQALAGGVSGSRAGEEVNIPQQRNHYEMEMI